MSTSLDWKPTPSRYEQRTGGNLLKRLPSPLYEERKNLIKDTHFRDAVDLAEEAVLADPSPDRADRLLQDGIVYDTATLGVALAYEVIGDGVRFLALADLWHR